ncbi:GMC family oxidoreductase N-terminal domain-containing protein [Candidatus Poribacteria bacterium]|nr:GMC family oxidoreductase N-terminal domain-containing protein [Candidatus Poribacteria bacterium]
MGLQSTSKMAQTKVNVPADVVERNIIFVGEIMRYLLDHPQVFNSLPDHFELVILPDGLKYGFGQGTFPKDPKYDWNFIYFPTKGSRGQTLRRGKVTGGSSSVNACIFLRGLGDDFEAWVKEGNTLWDFNSVLPYFCKLENDLDFGYKSFHGDKGPITARRFKQTEWLQEQEAFYKACRAEGYPPCEDLNAPNSTGVGPLPHNIGPFVPGQRDGIRMSTAQCYLTPDVRKRQNLEIWPNCMGVRIKFDGKKATGVEYMKDNTPSVVNGQEIILSAGAIGSPWLLMLSGVGPANHLKSRGIKVIQNLPGIGKNLRDHPAVTMRWQSKAKNIDKDRHQVGLRYTASESSLKDDMMIYIVSQHPDPRQSDPPVSST